MNRTSSRSAVFIGKNGVDILHLGHTYRGNALFVAPDHRTTWRRQRRQGELAALSAKKRGPKVVVSPLIQENLKLLAANARLTKQLKNAGLIIAVQKKVAALMGNPIPAIRIGEENQ